MKSMEQTIVITTNNCIVSALQGHVHRAVLMMIQICTALPVHSHLPDYSHGWCIIMSFHLRKISNWFGRSLIWLTTVSSVTPLRMLLRIAALCGVYTQPRV